MQRDNRWQLLRRRPFCAPNPVRKAHIAVDGDIANLFKCTLLRFYVIIQAALLEPNLISDVFCRSGLVAPLRKNARRGR